MFRSAIGEPTPPAPPEATEDGDRDDGHHGCSFVVPKLIVLGDGSIRADGWTGSALVAWATFATIVAVSVVLETIAAWLSCARAQTLLLAAGIGVVIRLHAIAALVLLTVLVTLGRRVVRSWRARRSGR